jgi:hypothetical protein
MTIVKEHYEKYLSKYYTWMSGGLAKEIEENRKFFKDHHVRPRGSGVAVDLGAGSGNQFLLLNWVSALLQSI